MAALLWCTSGLSSDMQVSQEICHLYQHCVSGNLTYVEQFIATKGSKVNDLGPSVPQVQEVGAVMGPSISAFINMIRCQILLFQSPDLTYCKLRSISTSIPINTRTYHNSQHHIILN